MIDDEKEKANQNSIQQYIHEIGFEKDLIENSVENAVRFEKYCHVGKHADMMVAEYELHKQRFVLAWTGFQVYHAEIILHGFHDFFCTSTSPSVRRACEFLEK